MNDVFSRHSVPYTMANAVINLFTIQSLWKSLVALVSVFHITHFMVWSGGMKVT